MGSTKEDQAARRKATQDVIAANRPFFEERMRHYYAEAGLGEWSPRLSPEERAAQKAEAKKQATVKRIKAEADKAGISVLVLDAPGVEDKIKAAQDGTFEGVSFDWRGDENGFADEQTEDTDVTERREALASREAAPVTE